MRGAGGALGSGGVGAGDMGGLGGGMRSQERHGNSKLLHPCGDDCDDEEDDEDDDDDDDDDNDNDDDDDDYSVFSSGVKGLCTGNILGVGLLLARVSVAVAFTKPSLCRSGAAACWI